MIEHQCKACRAPIWYLRHAKTGKRAPIDVALSERGNIVVDLAHETYTVGKPGPGGHLNHFVTCPYAASFSPQTRDRSKDEY
jgi:hypothetical protein